MWKASLVLGVSERQGYRIKARVRQQGVKGVVYGNPGRRCNRKVREKEVKRIVELAKGKYRGFNDHRLNREVKRAKKERVIEGEDPPGSSFSWDLISLKETYRSIAAEDREKRPRG
jgi:transposase